MYLARYLRGGPIGNSRLVSYANGQVTFRYLDRKNPANPQTKEMTLSAAKFLERWSQHIPPAKMHTIRAYGLYPTGNKAKLEHARTQLGQAHQEQTSVEGKTNEEMSEESEPKRCPICNQLLVTEALELEEPVRPWNVKHARVKQTQRAPPSRQEALIG